jgi:hypothetical protein
VEQENLLASKRRGGEKRATKNKKEKKRDVHGKRVEKEHEKKNSTSWGR